MRATNQNLQTNLENAVVQNQQKERQYKQLLGNYRIRDHAYKNTEEEYRKLEKNYKSLNQKLTETVIKYEVSVVNFVENSG